MESFEFYNPTKIVFGQGVVQKLSRLLPSQKVMLLYGGGSIKKNGVYEQIIKSLAHCEIVEVAK